MDDSSDYSQYTDSDDDYDPHVDGDLSEASSCSTSDSQSHVSHKKLKRNKEKVNINNSDLKMKLSKPHNRTQSEVSNARNNVSTSNLISLTETENKSSVHVASMPSSNTGWRYKKQQYCLYCEKPFSKISRHLQYVHRNESDVAKAFSFDKKSKERRVRLRLLISRGNFVHNAVVSSEGKGDLVACRRPKKPAFTHDFTHCIHCQGLYARKSLWRHIRNCPQNSSINESSTGKKHVQSLSYMAFAPSPDLSKGFWKTVVCQMKHDQISDLIRKDKYILLLGEQMFNKLNPSSTKNDYIRQKMREVGRLLFEARTMTPMKCMEDFVLPSNFPHVIKAVRSVAGHCEETNTYKTPSLALKLGHSLAKIATSVECNAIMVGQEQLAQDARNFRVLQEYKWNESISAAAGTTLNEAKMNKPQILPFTEDVKTLHSFLKTEMEKYKNALKENSDVKSYASLCKLTLTRVILFNRRRGGETARLKLESYVSREQSPIHEDLATGLSDFEKSLCKHFQRVEIRGKRGRMVPVLLTPEMVSCMDLLIEKRRICQVPSENVHLFARPNALSSYRGSDALREYAEACGARNPTALSSTKLRKQIATLSTVLNLKENEMDQLANFLGHDIRIHRQYYRLPESTLQLAKMSKLLIAMERGALSEIQGVQLDDIVIDPKDEIEDTDANTSSDEAEIEDLPESQSPRAPQPSTLENPRTSDPNDQHNRKGEKQKISESFSDQSHLQEPSSTQSNGLEEERRGTESTLLEVQCKVSTVSDGVGCHVICWCWSTVFSEVQGQRSRLPGNFSTSCFLLLTNFMEMQFSFSKRTWHLHTVPKLPVPGLRTMVSLFLIGLKTHLTLTT
ncbi:uncharacterized protein [Hoplias malabaricus]|uniref:uncharacterized protein n=1 Tax=Hoplias malabaricus TaxID=27720 RepID=UPI0034629EB5